MSTRTKRAIDTINTPGKKYVVLATPSSLLCSGLSAYAVSGLAASLTTPILGLRGVVLLKLKFTINTSGVASSGELSSGYDSRGIATGWGHLGADGTLFMASRDGMNGHDPGASVILHDTCACCVDGACQGVCNLVIEKRLVSVQTGPGNYCNRWVMIKGSAVIKFLSLRVGKPAGGFKIDTNETDRVEFQLSILVGSEVHSRYVAVETFSPLHLKI
ncbi:hypothetical protein K439DRAFT_1559868 [Ramaria rubella]|nr:hypothetical protein K439DRAFT_1559868 [Ramaria rubella]